jgi:hypothetical protein
VPSSHAVVGENDDHDAPLVASTNGAVISSGAGWPQSQLATQHTLSSRTWVNWRSGSPAACTACPTSRTTPEVTLDVVPVDADAASGPEELLEGHKAQHWHPCSPHLVRAG